MAVLRYITHPEVEIDPTVPVPRWSLSDVGITRARAMIAQPWFAAIGEIVSSSEQKAIETASIMAAALDLPVEVRASTDEIDRSATGYVPHERHDALAERLFGEPNASADGWERAVDASARVCCGLEDLLEHPRSHDVAVVGHGGVGTLLYCHLAGEAIDRRHDQPGAGHYWSFDLSEGCVVHDWRPIDEIENP